MKTDSPSIRDGVTNLHPSALTRRQTLWLGLGSFTTVVTLQNRVTQKVLAMTSGSNVAFSSRILDDAIAANLVRWQYSPNVGTEYGAHKVLHTGKAMNLLALVAYFNPGARGSNGTKVTNRLVAHIRHAISGGKEPMCRGVIAGWADNALAQSLTLAKHTPAVWNQLSGGEKEKCDWLMRALAIAGNWCQNWENHVHTGLAQSYNWRKTWNPNHQEGYVGVMIAAHLYFGGANAVNQILTGFNYNTYMNRFQKLGFTNIRQCWQRTGKTLMERGGTDQKGGKSKGVKIPFTYEKPSNTGIRVPYEPFALYEALAARMYSHTAANKSSSGRAYIKKGSTPVLGQPGMCYEFQARDAQGERSSARYAYDGWCNSVLTRATIQALGHWGSGGDRKQVDNRMKVGSIDLVYKLEQGYHSREKGTSKDHFESSVAKLGYFFVKDVWEKTLKVAPVATPAPPPIALPAAPANFNGQALSASQVMLLWAAPGSGVDGIEIERRSPGSNTFTRLATVDAGINAYEDLGLQASTQYTYRVRALNQAGQSAYSAPITIATQAIPQPEEPPVEEPPIETPIEEPPVEPPVEIDPPTAEQPPVSGALAVASLNPSYPVGNNLAVGQAVWSDRQYSYTAVPREVQGLQFIQTAKKANGNANRNWLQFAVQQPVTLYVAYAYNPPKWLSDWTPTGQSLKTSNRKTLKLYKKSFPAGTITLPGNKADYGQSTWTYTVMLAAAASIPGPVPPPAPKPAPQPAPQPAPAPEPKPQPAPKPEPAPQPNPSQPLKISQIKPNLPIGGNLSTGETVWRDRGYTYTSVPVELQGLRFIQTAKNANGNAKSRWLSFEVNQPVTLYVAYAYRPPQWLSDWTPTGESLKTSNRKTLKLYKKSFPAGTITLPGNKHGRGSSTWTYTVAVKKASETAFGRRMFSRGIASIGQRMMETLLV